jgi:hypothetical protein
MVKKMALLGGEGGGSPPPSLLGKQSQSGNIRFTVGQYWLIIKVNGTNSVSGKFFVTTRAQSEKVGQISYAYFVLCFVVSLFRFAVSWFSNVPGNKFRLWVASKFKHDGFFAKMAKLPCLRVYKHVIELKKGYRTYELTFSALFKSVKIPQVIQAL